MLYKHVFGHWTHPQVHSGINPRKKRGIKIDPKDGPWAGWANLVAPSHPSYCKDLKKVRESISSCIATVCQWAWHTETLSLLKRSCLLFASQYTKPLKTMLASISHDSACKSWDCRAFVHFVRQNMHSQRGWLAACLCGPIGRHILVESTQQLCVCEW